ncbi:hypothetical protein GIY62_00015 [Burkholderia plantarii]|uniref:hypothetical protein n=1 Tax=Burkholderia plantarii TaxID=41899 RepID=UPI00272B37ED|nr:hypothetical protein [Burkholderia plantarii]WLE61088.1 hypothetical protein GIY62_00015 [Burkholderia plantarii]
MVSIELFRKSMKTHAETAVESPRGKPAAVGRTNSIFSVKSSSLGDWRHDESRQYATVSAFYSRIGVLFFIAPPIINSASRRNHAIPAHLFPVDRRESRRRRRA